MSNANDLSLVFSPICPIGRSIAYMLAEKKIPFNAELSKNIDLFSTPSFCIGDNCFSLNSSFLIFEYINDLFKDSSMIYGDPIQRLEIRKLCYFIEQKVHKKGTQVIVFEKIINKKSSPNSTRIGEASKNISACIGYLESLLSQRSKLAGSSISACDIIATAHISVLDYLNEINWSNPDIENLKSWYSAMKSRPAFRDILNYTTAEIKPPKHYFSLDF